MFSILKPELRVYVERFGEGRADFCFAAELDGAMVGAAWSRIMNDYGHVDDETPSLAMSVLKGYRRRGIGTALMGSLMRKLRAAGFRRISLSVQRSNVAARRLYDKFGFKVYRDAGDELILITW